MNHDKVTEEVQEKAALYALGAMSRHEARAFESHLRQGCSACEAELMEFEKVVGELGAASTEVAPSPYLRDLLTARIQKEAEDAPPANPFYDRREPATAQTVIPTRSFARDYLPWAMAASFAIFALVSFFAWQQSSRATSSLEQELASTRIDYDRFRAEAISNSERVSELTEIKSALASPGSRLLTLAGQQPAPASSVKIYWDVEKNRWVVEADLPPPPPGKVYQLWFVTSDAKISAGLIKSDHKGHGFAVVAGPNKKVQPAAAAITLEPEGGSEQPTSEIFAMGKVGI